MSFALLLQPLGKGADLERTEQASNYRYNFGRCAVNGKILCILKKQPGLGRYQCEACESLQELAWLFGQLRVINTIASSRCGCLLARGKAPELLPWKSNKALPRTRLRVHAVPGITDAGR